VRTFVVLTGTIFCHLVDLSPINRRSTSHSSGACSHDTMSVKGKNLQFDASEPAFLRRLRNQARGTTEESDPDRHINPVTLPKKPKSGEPDDDGPVYVIDGSDANVSKEDYDGLVKEKGGHVDGADPSDNLKSSEVDTTKKSNETEKGDGSNRPKQRVADVGVSTKKRKATKIGADGDEDTSNPAAKAQKKKPKKPKVKLSFGHDGYQ
jgi:hypothetical protein